MSAMTHEEFMAICGQVSAYPHRGWQGKLVQEARKLGHSLSQPTISQISRDPNKNISPRTAMIMRSMADGVASGDINPSAPALGATTSNVVDNGGVMVYKDPDDDLTKEEIKDDIEQRFDTFDECIGAVFCGNRRSVLVSGPPGSGKSHIIDKHKSVTEREFFSVTGSITAVGLYKLLYRYKDGGIVAFDDCDTIFESEEALNLLKGALDLKPPGRANMISWMKMTKGLVDEDEEEIPKTFDFQGHILFMTNIDFEKEIERGTKRSKHLSALLSRSGYMTLGLHSKRRRLLRIEQVVENSTIMEDNLVTDEADKQEIMEFITEHMDSWRELSLRLVPQICNYFKNNPKRWQRHAKALLMKSKRK